MAVYIIETFDIRGVSEIERFKNKDEVISYLMGLATVTNIEDIYLEVK